MRSNVKSLTTTEHMSTSFLGLPSELRNRIYELCLAREEPFSPWANDRPCQIQAPSLLRANKTIHREASPFFYAQNCFDLTNITHDDVYWFFETIGRNNANCIRHLRVIFPLFDHLEPGYITLAEDSIALFAIIQSFCASLRTLTTSPSSTHSMALRLDRLGQSQVVTEALKRTNSCFRAILSLQNIVIEVHWDEWWDMDMRRKMESYGWKINVAAYVEEEDDNDDIDWYASQSWLRC
jgi:hypothetical protein